jgi:ligand-binding sensor domain-containing protein
MKIICFLLTLIIFIDLSTAQVTNWKNYTDMKNIRAASVSGDKIWTATSGGTFTYNLTDGSYTKYHKVEGLSGGALTSLAVDASGKVWLGSNTGTIDVYNPSTEKFKAVLDIFNSLKQPKGVNDLVYRDGKIYAAADFGISVIDPDTYVFIDTYSKFGSLSSNIKVSNIFIGDYITAALDDAVAVQKPGAINLSSPDSWDVYSVIHLSLARKVNTVAIYNNTILAGTQVGVFALNGASFVPFELIGNNVSFLDVIEGVLYIGTSEPARRIFKYDGQLTQIYQGDRLPAGVFFVNNELFASSDNGVLKIQNNEVVQVIKPNAPYSNLFSSMTVDSKGNFWSASARDPSGQGFYKYDNQEWSNFNLTSVPPISFTGYFVAYSHGDEVYLGSWGRGFMKIKDNQLIEFNASNTPMEGVAENPDYLVISGLGKDSKNNLWILNFGPVTKEYLSVLTPDSTWYNFKVPAMADQYLKDNFGLVIDQQDTKWYFCQNEGRPGLFYFNENNTFNDLNDDKSGYIQNLNERVLSLAVDRRGDIWIGTGLGVNIINNPSTVFSSNPQIKPSSVFALRQQSINAIVVDPLNRKWIGTNQGLLLVNSDGSALLESYDIKNSPLLSDEIRSLTIDENTGIVYAGTDAGLTAFETIAKSPAETFTALLVYPNPLKLGKSLNNSVTIDGLIKDSQIKILNITGKVVNQFSSPGGRVAYWNGKDSDGEYVNSGIYIIVASDPEGNSVMSAKVAVLKE